MNLYVTRKYALTFHNYHLPTEASNIAKAYWPTKYLQVPISYLPSLNSSYVLRSRIENLKIVFIHLMLDMTNILFLTQDPQISIIQIQLANLPSFITWIKFLDLKDPLLRPNGQIITKRQPDGGFQIRNVEYSFLVVKIAQNKANKHILQKIKDFVRYLKRKIIYVIVVSIYYIYNHNTKSTEVDSEKFSITRYGKLATEFTLSSLKDFIPTTPSKLEKRYGVILISNVNAKTSTPLIDSFATSKMLEVSDLVG